MKDFGRFMVKRFTIIEDSQETIIRLLESLRGNEEWMVELQPIMVAPFFSKEIEEAIVRFNPDLIILDLRLTRDEESGFRVLRQLKTSEKVGHVPVVICSKYIGAGSKDPNMKRAISFGADAALPKTPFPNPEEFFDIIKAHEKKMEQST